MGQEITHRHFKQKDFEHYRLQMEAEMRLLRQWFRQTEPHVESPLKVGFEMELCLVDQQGLPAGINQEFIDTLQDSHVTPELAKFNIELNSEVYPLNGSFLQGLHQELKQFWETSQRTAKQLEHHILMTGILPSLRKEHLDLSNMSNMTRYHVLNEQVLRSRKGRAIELDILGRESLKTMHQDVMLESAATSFQLHLQIPFYRAVRYYNAAQILSAPLVAIAANSPYLFGKDLWCETRIPVFEQAVSAGGYDGAAFGPIKRVSFGSGYVKESLLECFEENIEHYPVLLPEVFDRPADELAHLSLHNGTVWRWNRPLIDKNLGDEETRERFHLRLEHRVLPAGPTVVDCIANAALFYGAVTALANQYEIPEQHLPFVQAKDNFYLAARQGLNARLNWLHGQSMSLAVLLREHIIPMAKEGLSQIGVTHRDIDLYLGIIEARLQNQQTGSMWQRAYVEKHGNDMQKLTLDYIEHQRSGQPVHLWEI